MDRTPRRVFGILALTLVAAASASARRQTPAAGADGRTYRWVGTATLAYAFEPAVEFRANDFKGSLRDDRTVRVVMKERRSSDVHDASGRLVGRIIFLEDGGSTWTGRVSDTEVHLDVIKMLGDQSDRGKAGAAGVIYRSLVTPNPIEAALPDGTYCFSLWTSAIKYVFTLTEPGRPNEVSNEQSINGMTAGDCSLVRKIALVRSPVTTDALVAGLAGPARPGEQREGRSRTLVNGAMTGDYRLVTGGTTAVASWNLRHQLNVEGAITAVDPAWRPKFQSTTTVTASIPESLGATGKFRFTLSDVSREPGVTMNSGIGTSLDLRFSGTQPGAMTEATQTADGYTIETTASATSASVSITALDYGAWGRLKAEVNVDGEWYDCLAPDGATTVTLPLDADGNHIWDTWEKNSGIAGRPANEDVEDVPVGGSKGDGLSNFEEYRGFMVQGDWVTTDPKTKELFIFDETTLGLGLTYKTGLMLYQIEQSEMSRARVVNFNRGRSTLGPQKALHLKEAELDPGTLGITNPRVGTPNQVSEILLDFWQLMAESAPNAIESTVAHEIGHGLSIDHHGDWSERSCRLGPKGLYAPWGGVLSGDRTCVMSYSGANYYTSWDGKCYTYPWPSSFGTEYCTVKTGTGLNSGARRMEDGRALPVSGDATMGNCVSQMRVK
ncbi:MAG: hypothetical protein EPO35_01680 [Acidobacteria bacterium]|nr:MAG: hypothetical protein EPO35_01680 [Acidobacteriota bacterium]